MCKYCEDKYVKSLEQLLIFMCQNNEETWKELMELGQQGNNAWTNIPMIQGMNNHYVGMIAKIEFEKPEYTFEGVYEIMTKKLNEMTEEEQIKACMDRG